MSKHLGAFSELHGPKGRILTEYVDQNIPSLWDSVPETILEIQNTGTYFTGTLEDWGPQASISYYPVNKLLWFSPHVPNNPSASLSISGLPPLPFTLGDGLTPAGAGTMVPGVVYLLRVGAAGSPPPLTGTFFEVLSLSGPPGPPGTTVLNRTQLAQLPTSYQAVFLLESGREGMFKWSPGDYSAQVTADPMQGVYVPLVGQSGSSGAWVRNFSGPHLSTWFGARPDGVTNSTNALQGMLNLLVAFGGSARFNGGNHRTESLLISNSTAQIHIECEPNCWLEKHTLAGGGSNVLDIFNSQNITIGNLNLNPRYSTLTSGLDSGGHGLTIRDCSNIRQTGGVIRVKDWNDNFIIVYTSTIDDPPIYKNVHLTNVEGISPVVTDANGHVLSGALARNGILFEDMLQSGCDVVRVRGVLVENPGYAVQFKNNCHQCWYGQYIIEQSYVGLVAAGSSGVDVLDAVDCWFGTGHMQDVKSAVVLSHAKNTHVAGARATFHPDGVARSDGVYPAFIQISGLSEGCYVNMSIDNYDDLSLPPVYFGANRNRVEVPFISEDCNVPIYVTFVGHECSLVIGHDMSSSVGIPDLRDRITDTSTPGTNDVELHWPGHSWVVGSGDADAPNALFNMRTNRLRLQSVQGGILLGDPIVDADSDTDIVDVNAYAYAGFIDYSEPSSGFNDTISAHSSQYLIRPAGTLASGTLHMPSTPSNGMLITISSTQTITALNLLPGAGQSIVGAITTLAANAPINYRYREADTTWYRA